MPLIAPADEPTIRSKTSFMPSRSSAATMPAETTPRMPPPSSASATRCGSWRAPGTEPASARSRRSRATGWSFGATADIALHRSGGWYVPDRMSAPLVIGVDVGSQGTCAQALELDGTLVTASYAAHEFSYPRPGWAEQDCDDWLHALVATLSEVRETCRGRTIAALSFGSQLDGLVAARADGSVLHRALIWCDRRAGEECDEVAARVDPAALRALTGCNIDPSHVGPKIAWLARHEPERRGATVFLLPGSWVAWRASGVLAVDPSNASSTGLLDPRMRAWSPEACDAYGVDVEQARAGRPRARAARPGRAMAARRDGTRRRTRWSSWGAATRWRPRSARASSSPASCATCSARPSRCAPSWPSPAHDPTGVVELHPHADPDTWLLENPGWLSGGAYRWFRDELGTPEIAPRRQHGRATSTSCSTRSPAGAAGRRRRDLGAGARGRDGAGVESARARGLVRPHGGARARAPHARADRGQRAGAARRASRRSRVRRRPRRARSCASAVERGDVCCWKCGRT